MSPDIEKLAARLGRLEDIEEIRALFLRYADCLDANDFAGYANLFASDGELIAQLGTAKGRRRSRRCSRSASAPTSPGRARCRST